MENTTVQAGAAEPALAKASFPHLSASPSDRPWMGSGLGEKPPPSTFIPESCASPPLPLFSGSFLMNTPVKNKGNYIKKEHVKIALRARL